MAGGTFTSYSKIRPGAYINFKTVARAKSTLSDRGIVTFPMPLSWGEEAEVIKLTASEFVSGKSFEKLGLQPFEASAQFLREAFKNCFTALIYRINKGGVKANAELTTDVNASAKYTGEFGNKISVAIKANDTKFDVVTTVNGAVKNTQTIETVADFKPNEWIELSGTGTLTPVAGMGLTGGTDGTTSDTNYTDYFNAITSYKWNTMAIPSVSATLPPLAETYIKNMRENKGKKVQVVVLNYDADYEGVISVSQGYKTETETVEPSAFAVYIAALTAGTNVGDKGNRYHVIPDAIDFVNPLTDEEIDEALKGGKLVLSRRQDDAIVIEDDINSLHTFTDEKSSDYAINRIIRTLDDINNHVSLIFETKYIGKVDNTASGRNVFKAEVIGYLNELQNVGAIQNFSSETDISIEAGQTKDSAIVNLAIETTDSLGKLFMTVTVG